ncbi:MAG: nucleotidyltransferase family protein [Halanaerobium sp.]|nr:nucleotidyltransferase family protein [Halanaerobium sp.]
MLTAVILAAGEGRRMGQLKQLLPWNDQTIIETVLDNVCACTSIDDEIRLILGAGAERVEQLLAGYHDPRLRIMANPAYPSGMLSSIRRGLEGLPRDTFGVMFVLGDQPMIDSGIFQMMSKEFLKSPAAEIMAPFYRGRRGHPVFIRTSLLPEVAKLSGPGGLRSLLKRFPEKVQGVEVGYPEVIMDLDYVEEYERLKEIYGQDDTDETKL